jgi:hypothetical protein
MLCLEKVEPQIPVGLHPQVPLADCHKNGGLRDGVGGEMMELHLVVVKKLPHKLARRHPEPLSWKATKLTTYPSGGAGSRWSDGDTLHSGWL